MLKQFVPIIILILTSIHLNAAEPENVPIKIPEGNNLKLTVHAKGEQIYKCTAANGGYEWQWQAPDAILYDKDKQTKVGTHGAGPLWTYQDGSSVKGKMIQKIEAPDPDSAPWMLLEAKEAGGHGLLAETSFILRFNTKGGLPPVAGCDAKNAGKEARITYSADYSFYGQ